MARSVKLGITGILLLVCSVVVSFWNSELPINFVLAFLSCVLALLAAQQGSKWWLVLPCTVLAVGGLIFYVGFHAM